MAKRKAQPEEVPPDSKKIRRRQVELDLDLSRKVAVVAAALDMTVPDWVNNRLRPIVERELPAALRELGLANE